MDKNSSRKSSDEDVPMQVLIDHNRLDSVSSGRNVPHSQILYTPIHSVDPNEFSEDFRLNRYPLRFFPKEINEKIRIFCVVTMYNEGREELSRTLTGIANNLRALEKKSGYPNFWEEVIVCIVADGRTKLNQDSMDYMIENGICSYEMMASYLDSKNSDPEIPDVSVHLFESVVEFGSDGDVVENGQKMRIMFALKERNAGKIDSHWWFFNAFSVVLNPNYCFLLDVGTVPEKNAFFYMHRSFEREPNVAGIAGEISTLKKFNWRDPLVAAQSFEYKVSNILDKTMESMFGYITVLPGAFSAYRWEALQGDPLKQYFHHLFTPLKKTRPFESNMYLAEDRILCYELVSKRGHHYRLKYVKEAVGRTDVPTKLVDLLKQRRRWLNGSLFALVYALLGWSRLMLNSKHSVWRKILFTIEYMYFALLLVFQWFAVSNLYLTFYYIMKYGSEPLSSIFPYVRYAFLGVLLIQFVLGLGNKPHRVSRLYVFSSAFFGVFAYAILGLTVYQVVLSDFDKRVTLYATITFGLIFAVSFLYGEILSVSSSFLQYLFFVPTYIIIFPVYSLCNVHDISWGTKNIDEAAFSHKTERLALRDLDSERMRARLRRMQREAAGNADLREQVQARFEVFRSHLLLLWMLSNALFVSALTALSDHSDLRLRDLYLSTILASVLASTALRSLGAVLFLLADALRDAAASFRAVF